MLPERSTLSPTRTTSLLLALAVALAGLAGLQTWHPASAAAATGPVAVDDVVHLQANGYYDLANIPYLANDSTTSGTLDVRGTTFPDDQPAGGTVAADHLSVDFGALGQLSFNSEFARMQLGYGNRPGTVAARYRIVDSAGATSDALITIVIGPGGYGLLQLKQGRTTTADVLAGDVPGNNADGTPGTIDTTSVHFTVSSGHLGATVSADGRTLTDPGRGVFRASPTTGVVTFDPEDTYRGGGGDHVSYVAQDTTRAADGTVEHHSYRGRLDIWVSTIDPRPVTDSGTTVHHASLTLPGVTNDLPGDPSVPLRPELTVFTRQGNPSGSTLYDHGHGLKVADAGWWTIDPAGTITFTPIAGYAGQAPTVFYQVTDANGTTGYGSVQVYVASGPAAEADAATTPQNVDVVLDVPKNDTPGDNADRTPGSLDRTSVRFTADGQPGDAVLSRSDRTLTVPDQGVYTADATSGKITFDPAPTFVGKASPVTYGVRDTVRRTDGRVVHNLATATAGVSVSAVTPVAKDNWANTTVGHAVQVPVLGNDRPGAASAPLVPSSVRLKLGPGLPKSSTLSSDGRTLTVTGRGVYAARSDGVVVVTPAPGFSGVVPTVGYTVSDSNGTTVSATVTVGVAKA